MQHSRAVLTRVAKLQCARPISISCVRNNRSIPPAEYAAIKDFTEKVVDTAALPEPPEGWTHTPSLRDVEKRLGKKIETVNSNVRAPSVEKNEFDGAAMMQSVDLGDWSQDDSTSGETFTPGTFVELRRSLFPPIIYSLLCSDLHIQKRAVHARCSSRRTSHGWTNPRYHPSFFGRGMEPSARGCHVRRPGPRPT
jgi:hypothetical protein